jgi:mycothiol synthase
VDLIPRPFQSETDLTAMRRLLIKGRLSASSAYYIHPGDLNWWFSYFTNDPRQHTTLWHGREDPSRLQAWALFSSDWCSLDVFLSPALNGTSHAHAVWDQAEQAAAVQHGRSGLSVLRSMWVAESDEWTKAHLTSRGFTLADSFIDLLTLPLDVKLDEPLPPLGFQIRSTHGEAEALLRSLAQHTACESNLPIEEYINRYTRFMHSPGYKHALDLMLTKLGDEQEPEELCTAFAIVWPDPQTKVGLFEPVGVAPGYQRLGLGRIIVKAGLHRLQEQGMHTAAVCGMSSLPEAREFYASLGFRSSLKLLTFEKEIRARALPAR